ncbi:hypothetical protein GQ53DRAFT_789300 [Thozetella sp. PMI_491]|nr:hypothetical protein GQ53DRAFT_789300 [Thozetella sp. PMI_491]
MAAQPLFGLVPACLPVITVPTETPSPTSFLYALPSPAVSGGKSFSHLTVFLLPGIVLPEGTAAGIYLVTPGLAPGAAPNFKFLGGIGPGKESAIFKLSSGENVALGVSVEPADSVAQRIGELEAAKAGAGALTAGAQSRTGQPSTLVLAQRIIKNAFNFLSSFSGQAGQVEVVPLKAFEEWWRKFESKVRSDPGFLERDD